MVGTRQEEQGDKKTSVFRQGRVDIG